MPVPSECTAPQDPKKANSTQLHITPPHHTLFDSFQLHLSKSYPKSLPALPILPLHVRPQPSLSHPIPTHPAPPQSIQSAAHYYSSHLAPLHLCLPSPCHPNPHPCILLHSIAYPTHPSPPLSPHLTPSEPDGNHLSRRRVSWGGVRRSVLSVDAR